MKKLIAFIACLLSLIAFAQVNRNDTIRTEYHPRDSISAVTPKSETEIVSEIERSNAPAGVRPQYSPTKAGLYSAVLPGLGQYYNKKYWKIPLAWGGIGAGVGYTLWVDKRYKRYRNAFVAEINGVPHEFSDYNISNLKEALGREQDRWKRNRDYAIAITGLVYILNIVDAVVDAHLYEGRNDPDLAVRPAVLFQEYGQTSSAVGFTLHYNF
ncbi:DUF5683 domain-containing protein [Chryseobacterium sp. MFBS3-17]|uniref:DUF5683 domain-containing protein n=1 Tax=Chryseobacterium sp. MFBS3-17 TaxID=2886689 RepID=UPI001D0E9169|nr:DUF5683 domain-containing protein [Chryseobacterium sp. MFBS3-17]MCC2590750.1 DUF5683 domain-containing protein [Chryseobacterium sp. MFBS3-17]